MAASALTTMTRLGSEHQQANAHDILAELAEQVGSHQRADKHRATAAALRSTRTPPEPIENPSAADLPANPD
jgi:hypothetical protein